MSDSGLSRRIIAPITGQVVDLGQVPDPVFSERMTGDGIAILAEGNEALAPCDGVITLFFDTNHAFAVTADDGIQVLVHFGLDTVILNSEGITVCRRAGERVVAGEPVIRLDSAVLERRGINRISPVIIVNYEQARQFRCCPAGDALRAGIDTAIEYSL